MTAQAGQLPLWPSRSASPDRAHTPTGVGGRPDLQSGVRLLPSPEQVADLLATVSAANHRLAKEADRILGSGSPITQATLDHFVHLAEQLRPAARARTTLSSLDTALLMDGAAIWAHRRAGVPSGQTSAAARAARRWTTRSPA
jgi:hypothetical protein